MGLDDAHLLALSARLSGVLDEVRSSTVPASAAFLKALASIGQETAGELARNVSVIAIHSGNALSTNNSQRSQILCFPTLLTRRCTVGRAGIAEKVLHKDRAEFERTRLGGNCIFQFHHDGTKECAL